jgi:hypothetical protein
MSDKPKSGDIIVDGLRGISADGKIRAWGVVKKRKPPYNYDAVYLRKHEAAREARTLAKKAGVPYWVQRDRKTYDKGKP